MWKLSEDSVLKVAISGVEIGRLCVFVVRVFGLFFFFVVFGLVDV